jgi:hypothetical protein
MGSEHSPGLQETNATAFASVRLDGRVGHAGNAHVRNPSIFAPFVTTPRSAIFVKRAEMSPGRSHGPTAQLLKLI